jgi:hypothetical protein
METPKSNCTREMTPEPGDWIATAALLPREAPVHVMGAVNLAIEATGYPAAGGWMPNNFPHLHLLCIYILILQFALATIFWRACPALQHARVLVLESSACKLEFPNAKPLSLYIYMYIYIIYILYIIYIIYYIYR